MEILHACVRLCVRVFFGLFNEERRGDEKRREERRWIYPYPRSFGIGLRFVEDVVFSTLLYFRLIATLHLHLLYSTLPYMAFASVWMSYAYAGKSRVGSVRLMR